MKTIWKAAVAAMAMVAATAPAHAVRWVEYKVSGFGTVTEQSFFPAGENPAPRTYDGFMTMTMVVPLDPTSGEVWTSDGNNYTFNAFPIRNTASYTEDAITGTISIASSGSSLLASATSGGLLSYRRENPTVSGRFVQTFTGSASQLLTRDVAVTTPNQFLISVIPASEVPEPATWGMMLAGFGMVGAGLRSRRRTAVTYA